MFDTRREEYTKKQPRYNDTFTFTFASPLGVPFPPHNSHHSPSRRRSLSHRPPNRRSIHWNRHISPIPLHRPRRHNGTHIRSRRRRNRLTNRIRCQALPAPTSSHTASLAVDISTLVDNFLAVQRPHVDFFQHDVSKRNLVRATDDNRTAGYAVIDVAGPIRESQGGEGHGAGIRGRV